MPFNRGVTPVRSVLRGSEGRRMALSPIGKSL
jgi:hypothetical protein